MTRVRDSCHRLHSIDAVLLSAPADAIKTSGRRAAEHGTRTEKLVVAAALQLADSAPPDIRLQPCRAPVVMPTGSGTAGWRTDMLRVEIETQSFYSDIFGVRRRAVARVRVACRRLDNTSGMIDLSWPGGLLLERRAEGDLTVARNQPARHGARPRRKLSDVGGNLDVAERRRRWDAARTA